MRRAYKRVYRTIFPFLLLPILYLFRALPLKIALKAGESAGALLFGIMKKERGKAIRNIALVFGEEMGGEEVKDLARRCFIHMGRGLAELLHARRFVSEAGRWFRIEKREYIDSLIQRGRGGILITGHTGNWELCAFFLKRMGYPLNVVGRRLHYPLLNSLLLRYRRGFGIDTVERGETGEEVDVRTIIRRLKGGEFFAFLIDQDAPVRGGFIPFFGKEAHTPLGPALLALKLGVPTLAGFMARDEDGSYTLHIKTPPLFLDAPYEGSDLEGEAMRMTSSWNRQIEEHIRRFPEQWVWMHERWKRGEEEGRVTFEERG